MVCPAIHSRRFEERLWRLERLNGMATLAGELMVLKPQKVREYSTV